MKERIIGKNRGKVTNLTVCKKLAKEKNETIAEKLEEELEVVQHICEVGQYAVWM